MRSGDVIWFIHRLKSEYSTSAWDNRMQQSLRGGDERVVVLSSLFGLSLEQ